MVDLAIGLGIPILEMILRMFYDMKLEKAISPDVQNILLKATGSISMKTSVATHSLTIHGQLFSLSTWLLSSLVLCRQYIAVSNICEYDR